MLRTDWHRIRHMLEAAEEARSFALGRSRDDLTSDRQLALALVKCIEIIGEAATNVSTDGRQQAPHIPWQSAVRMRNRLTHAYFSIDFDVGWDTVQVDLPPLIVELQAVLAACQADADPSD